MQHAKSDQAFLTTISFVRKFRVVYRVAEPWARFRTFKRALNLLIFTILFCLIKWEARIGDRPGCTYVAQQHN
ncbi:hypothetical protein HBI23_154740 [Parastagonospora nodorum]|nr:hypothetical protein HBI12_153080 [Parastagonospora nodorum]KAH5418351.1 hypothetical protein HBI47_142680 [Parastagonospora nodorum]KAH5654475.1 hypothetical protein HBI23_154740 [Parastagonospora nodorum]KAH6057803.1 hypothetical protein HBI67_183040 [Parastagonospora nodorum]KAH6066723.1 hypothetical protein HBI66_152750 [Parastagonospora nodorum]